MPKNLFDGLNNLTFIDLNENNIQIIEKNAFNHLSNLKVLNLSSQNLTGLDAEGFNGLTSLSKLYLDNNSLRSITKDHFISLNNLTILSINSNNLTILSNNYIYSIDSNSFRRLINLQKLELKRNKINTLDYWLTHLINLAYLDLESNYIPKIKITNLKGLSCLKSLNLKSNLIESIESKSFETNINLKEIYLDNNLIKEINADLFYGIKYLNKISFTNNSILSIINKYAFNNTFVKNLYLSIDNFTLENIENLKYSLNSIQKKYFLNINYYDSTYIENRNDLDCKNILRFVRKKIFYNLDNDNDFDYFVRYCDNLKKLEVNL
jgi:Leucine-rich repeat (LRR) protein